VGAQVHLVILSSPSYGGACPIRAEARIELLCQGLGVDAPRHADGHDLPARSSFSPFVAQGNIRATTDHLKHDAPA